MTESDSIIARQSRDGLLTHCIPVQSIDDPRLWPYINLKDRELAREGDCFIAEGEFIVRRLLASDFQALSILLATRKVADLAPLTPPDVPIYVATDQLIRQILGYKFHSGVMACGRRKVLPPALQTLVESALSETDRPVIVACPGLHQTDNLGSLIRLSAGLGVSGMILGEQCCDPWWRRSIRVSMGAAFFLPIRQSQDIRRDLLELRDQYEFEILATVTGSTPGSNALDVSFARADRCVILFGSESQGLDQDMIDHYATSLVTIPMRRGTDSLNVTHAAGIFLWHLTQ